MVKPPFILYILVVILALIVGCATQPPPDPLAGWKPLGGRERETVDAGIQEDYQSYIRQLPHSEERVGPTFLFEGPSGQHAMRMTSGLNGTFWVHILIYDKDNKRIKTLRYASGHYRS
jgi:hypothetical protein